MSTDTVTTTITSDPDIAPASTSDSTPPATEDSAFARLGGASVFEAIANRFYDLMDQDSSYKELRDMHAEDLGPMRTSLPRFLAGWAGGPRDWFEENPGRCMMSLHKPFTINQNVAGQWADAMRRAITDVNPKPEAMAQAMSDVLSRMAISMGR